MHQSLATLLVLAVCGHIACASAAEGEKEGVRTAAQEERACAGVANEGTKMRELRREMSIYYDKPIPEDLERRVRKHIDTVGKLKAECDLQRGQAALAPR